MSDTEQGVIKMITYKAELIGDYTCKTIEIKTNKTGLALVRQVKKELGCTGFKMQLVVVCGDFMQWVSPDFSMTLQPIN